MRKKYPQCRPRSGQNVYDYHNIGVNHCGEYECRKCSMGLTYKRYAVVMFGLIPLGDLKKSLKNQYEAEWEMRWIEFKILKQFIKAHLGEIPEGIYCFEDLPRLRIIIADYNNRKANI